MKLVIELDLTKKDLNLVENAISMIETMLKHMRQQYPNDGDLLELIQNDTLSYKVLAERQAADERERTDLRVVLTQQPFDQRRLAQLQASEHNVHITGIEDRIPILRKGRP